MPYQTIEDLPSNVTGVLPKRAQKMWMATFNAAYSEYGEERARRIAWAAIKKKFKKMEGKWVAKASDFDVEDKVFYEFQLEGKNVTESIDDTIMYDYVLSSTAKDGDGASFSEVFLKRAAEMINQEGLVGYIPEGGDHGLFKRLKEEGKTPREVEEFIHNLNSGVKAVKATYKDNKLHTTISVRKDLAPIVDKFSGISVEAWIPKDQFIDNTYLQGKLIGFAFTNNPSNPEAVRVAA